MSATAADLMDRCRGFGITLYLEGDELRFRGPRGAMTPELRQVVADNKAALVALLRPPPSLASAVPAERPQSVYLPCSCPTGVCWPCCNRPCEVCGRPTGSAFIRQCVPCGNAPEIA
jgi:hypothetical protein